MVHQDVQPGETETWTGDRLMIPPLPPSFLVGCKIIDINYYLEVIKTIFPHCTIMNIFKTRMFTCLHVKYCPFTWSKRSSPFNESLFSYDQAVLFLTKLCVLKIERHFFPLTFLSFVGGVEGVCVVFFCVLQCITTGCQLYLLQEFRIDVSKNKLPKTNRNTKCKAPLYKLAYCITCNKC